MATMPERSPYLAEAVKAIRPQVDTLRVYLNNFDGIPDCLTPEEVIFSQEAAGDLCAEGKFYWYDREEGKNHSHYLTIDDDLYYPPDYVERLKEEYDARRGQAVVGLHGYVFDDPITSYVYSRKEYYGFDKALDTPKPVHILGTNTVLLGHEALSLTLDNFPRRNTSDLQLAVVAQKLRVPLISVPRPENWVQENRPATAEGFSIWKEAKADGGRAKAELARRAIANWQLFPDPLHKD